MLVSGGTVCGIGGVGLPLSFLLWAESYIERYGKGAFEIYYECNKVIIIS